MVKFILYNPALMPLAKQLRQNMTLGEVLLWDELKNGGVYAFDFDRQRCLDNYIVDFYCKELMLAVEVDGLSHNHEEAVADDEIRQQKLESFGVKFLRFSEAEVKYERFNVLRTIETKIIELVKHDRSIKLPKEFNVSLLDD
ncbi:endonuclease domain-containing protein [Mucilaginibacter terrae]|uniref:endonuclease domain-containing protein n=1 Tax=Mucilaginibacter terrae TaxID=1955052 RepID=UPI0036428AA6